MKIKTMITVIYVFVRVFSAYYFSKTNYYSPNAILPFNSKYTGKNIMSSIRLFLYICNPKAPNL